MQMYQLHFRHNKLDSCVLIINAVRLESDVPQSLGASEVVQSVLLLRFYIISCSLDFAHSKDNLGQNVKSSTKVVP